MRRVTTQACLCLALTGSAQADALDCDLPFDFLQGVPHYQAEVPPAPPLDGACVLDGLQLDSQTLGWPDLKADRLRIAWGADWGSVDLGGFRVTPALGDTTLDDRLRQILRLQTADLTARLVKGPDGALDLTEFNLRLSGGTRLGLTLSLREVALLFDAPSSALLTGLSVDWQSDGRLLRPLLELLGERLPAGQEGDPVAAVRAVLARVVAALPEAALTPGSRQALQAMLDDLPLGRGRLTLRLEDKDGIGTADLGALALADDPLAPEALARLLDGTMLSADWQPGLQP